MGKGIDPALPHYIVQITNLPPTEIVCKCGALFTGADPTTEIKEHIKNGNPDRNQ